MLRRLLLTVGLVSLPLLLGYTASLPSRQVLLTIDGCAESGTEPIRLRDLAWAAGRDSEFGDPFTLTVVSVVSPHEFVVRGRYGLERARPLLTPEVAERLERMAPWRAELISLLAKRLEGTTLYEHGFTCSPLVSSEGLRLVLMWASDGTTVARFIDVQLDELERAHGAGPGDPDLARLTPGDDLLQEAVSDAVALAERWTDFRAPPELSVSWIRRSDLPALDGSLRASVRSMLGSCLGTDDDFAADLCWDAVSLPDGRILLDRDRTWRPLVLRFVLLHELMHQYQYALCRTKAVMACNVPAELTQGHASLLAREILRRAGVSNASLDLLLEWDTSSSGVQVLDDFRHRLGFAPDEAFAWLAAHPREAQALESERVFTHDGCKARDLGLAGSQPLDFEVHADPSPRNVTGRHVFVTIINRDSRPFSGSFSGMWHQQTNEWYGFTRGPAFSLRLPPQGRVVLDPGLFVDEGTSVHAVYRETPAPVFDG